MARQVRYIGDVIADILAVLPLSEKEAIDALNSLAYNQKALDPPMAWSYLYDITEDYLTPPLSGWRLKVSDILAGRVETL